MRNTNLFCLAALAMACLTATAMADAEPGDAKAVAKARKDYAHAMQGHDIGLQNAMRVELSFQLTKSKERVRHKGSPGGAQAPVSGNSAS